MAYLGSKAGVRCCAILIAFCTATALGWMVYGRKDLSGPERELIIFHAGSLAVPFAQISERFMTMHPDIRVRAEAAGSRRCARRISDLRQTCDLFGSSDYRVIEELLLPDHAEFNIRFATNEMAIAYTGRSRHADRISAANWHRLVLEDGVVVGRSDPNADPCGYRALMVFQLAEEYYRIQGLAERLTAGAHQMRSKETDLLALLEAGEIDYLLIYRSVAEQHGLRILRLPEQINLGVPEWSSLYEKATVRVSGKAPGEFVVRRGEPMIYSVTIPATAANRAAAEAWMALLLSPEGQAIMERNGQPFLQPPVVDGLDKLPASLRRWITDD